jgi:hypothetical protein
VKGIKTQVYLFALLLLLLLLLKQSLSNFILCPLAFNFLRLNSPVVSPKSRNISSAAFQKYLTL